MTFHQEYFAKTNSILYECYEISNAKITKIQNIYLYITCCNYAAITRAIDLSSLLLNQIQFT